MALSASVLSAALRSGLLSADCGAIDGDALTSMCDAIATAVVSHVTSAAIVTVSGVGSTLAGTSATGGPVTINLGAATGGIT